MDEMTAADATPPPPAPPLPNLVTSLEQATLLAKQLPSTSDPGQLQHIYSALHLAQHHLSSFLLSHSRLPLSPPQAEENSVSSATGAGEDNGSEPMQVGEEEGNSMPAAIDKVEERLRECFIKNKRPKRPLSPSAAAMAEERRLGEDGYAAGRIKGYDPLGTRLRALDLIDQFHA
ncbi:unnamed protein product [Linum tenue]|uniref:Uncharacterized protein n=1 Tax=Linum tenue TaxID=586396 RepID=A0AAV0PH58_9ROSI|nr:unnamed protein product [Linum tenue]CAI0471964.1 unnamed protein product [Linum tenue]